MEAAEGRPREDVVMASPEGHDRVRLECSVLDETWIARHDTTNSTHQYCWGSGRRPLTSDCVALR